MPQNYETETTTRTPRAAATTKTVDGEGSLGLLGENRPPVLNPIPAQLAHPDRLCTFLATASDPDFDLLTFTLVGTPPAGAFMDAFGTFTWTPTWAQLGTYTLTARVSDPAGLFDLKNFTVTVGNQAPILNPLPAVMPGHPGRPIVFTATASDPDLDPLIFSLIGAPVGATMDALGNFSWTPTWAQLGTFTFSVKVADPGGLSSTRSLSITVANQAPTIAPIPDPGPAHPGRLVAFSVMASDPDLDPLSYSLVSPPAGAEIDAMGNVTWTPTWAQLGAASITVRVTDPGGAFATRTVTVNVANQTPVLDPLPAVPAAHPERPVTFTATASDADLDPLIFSMTAGPVGATLDAGGNFLWVPTWAQLGAATVTVKVADPGGAFATRSVNINVANQPPMLAPLADQTVIVNMPVAFTAMATDPDMDPLTFTLVNPPVGATIDGAGNFSWTPLTAGAYTITVRVADPGGAAAQRSCTITVHE